MENNKIIINNKKVGFPIIIFIFLLGLFIVFMPNKPKTYHDKGIEVNVTITEKSHGKTKQYRGVYTNEYGNTVTANVKPCQKTVFTGDKLTGYYMPDDPSLVICYSAGQMVIFKIIGIALCAWSVFLIFHKLKTDS